MKRTISTVIAMSLAAALSLASGCSKEKKEDGKNAAAEVAGKIGAMGGAGASAASATGGLAVLPADSEFVLSFSLEGLRKSPMWTKIAPMFQAKLDSEMAKVKEACGIDPFTKFTSVLVGGKPSDEKSMVIVVRGFTKTELTTCGTALAKKDGKEVVITEEDGLTHIHDAADNKDMFVAWLDDTTAVMSPNPDKAWVKARAAGQGGLDGNAAFTALLKSVDTSSTIYVVAMPKAGGDMDMSKTLPGAQAFFGSLKVSDGLGIDAGVRFATAENAKSAHAMATQGVQQAKAMMPPAVATVIDKTKITATGNDMLVQLQLSTADLEALSAALGPMLGGMMGGMAK